MTGKCWQAFVCVAVLMLLLAGCGPSFESMAQERIAYARKGDGRIVIVAFEDVPGGGYVDGIRLAVDQLNTTNDGLLGRPVDLLVQPGGNDFDALRRSVRRIAANPQVTAVLGHRTSSVAVPASVIYEAAQVLFMPPFATAEQLTLHGFEFVLRMLPDSKTMANQSASVAALFGYQRLAVLHSRDDYSRELAFLFEDAARRREGMDIVFRGSFFGAEPNYRNLIGQLNGVDFDALYLSTGTKPGARVLKQMRELGLHQPVIGSDTLKKGDLIKLSAEAGDRTIVPVIYSPGDTSSRNRRFAEAYERAYGRPPNQDAAQGYDSVNILARIIERAGSTEPRVLATTAHYAPPMVGITGIHAYDPSGDIYGKSYRFQILRFGRWWSLPGVTAPYLLTSFREARRGLTDKPPAEQSGSDANVGKTVQTESADHSRLDPTALTSRRLSRAERYQDWLALVHEFLDFQRLGLVATRTDKGNDAVGLAHTVAKQGGFEVETCHLSESSEGDGGETGARQAKLEQAALACYSRLALSVDAMMVVPDSGLAPGVVRRLNHVLRAYDVPTFALAESLDAEYGLSLAITASGIDLDDPKVSLRFEGVLKEGMEVHDLNRKLANLPVVSVDLDALGKARPDLRELTVISNVLEVTEESSASKQEPDEPEPESEPNPEPTHNQEPN